MFHRGVARTVTYSGIRTHEYNEPLYLHDLLYNKVLGITNIFFYPMNSKYMEKNLDIMKPYYSKKANDVQLSY